MTRDEVVKLLKDHKDQLSKRYPLKSIALFGSYAREEQTSDSDIDVLVDFNGPIGWEIVDLVEDLENIFSGKKVDVISKGGIRPKLWPYIEEDLIYA